MKKPLLIFTHGGGRLGNQLINFAHIYSFWLEHKDEIDIINMGFWPYYSLFESTSQNPLCILSKDNKNYWAYNWLSRLFNKQLGKNRRSLNPFIRFIHLYYSVSPFAQSIMKGEVPNYLEYLNGQLMQDFNFDSPKSVELIKDKKRTALAGWPLRCWDVFEKQQDSVRRFFQFQNRYNTIAVNYINDLRSKYDKVIGVFIRQGDYKQWYDGQYYFDVAFYSKMMTEISSFYNAQKICFVIASDDIQSMDDFKNLNAYFTTGSVQMGGHFVESLAELSLCDFIISPPSTFSILAAFIGIKPLLPLCSSKQVFNEDEIIEGNIFSAVKHEHLSKAIK